MTTNNNSGAPGWVLPLFIMLLLTVQLATISEDARAQRIDILHGETLKAWNELETDFMTEAENGQG
ncbi:hypothetical protein [Photobacterium sp. J15]|uniref:hypothetical protein n=1 Tax=Photobacterium sp. J15 TaxID=265901 RepID=UPI0007E49D4B|nr:hypothetical protein [Photobacterium sp. J15]